MTVLAGASRPLAWLASTGGWCTFQHLGEMALGLVVMLRGWCDIYGWLSSVFFDLGLDVLHFILPVCLGS